MAKRKKPPIRISIEKVPPGRHRGFYRAYYCGTAGPTGMPLQAKCYSTRSVKATLTRWTNRHGMPSSVAFPQELGGLIAEAFPSLT